MSGCCLWISVELIHFIQIKPDGNAVWEEVFFSPISLQELVLNFLNSDNSKYLEIKKLPF